MKSYASVDRIEKDFVVCEVELVPVHNSKKKSFNEKNTAMCEISIEEFMRCFHDVKEGDILVVEHDTVNVSFVYRKDDNEKQRRIAILKNIKIPR